MKGTVIENGTYGACARIQFRETPYGEFEIKIVAGIMYIFRNEKPYRIASTFDIEIKSE